jgi:hypothetical protein
MRIASVLVALVLASTLAAHAQTTQTPPPSPPATIAPPAPLPVVAPPGAAQLAGRALSRTSRRGSSTTRRRATG